jgi:hypothetical protein
MTVAFARGPRALGICDRCGFRFLINTLRSESVRGIKRTSLVCSSCYDPDHPQNFQGAVPVYDPQALRTTRPDVVEAPVPAYTPPKIGAPT